MSISKREGEEQIMVKLEVINSNGRKTREFVAKDSDHADRIKIRIKNQLKPGHSYTFKVTSL